MVGLSSLQNVSFNHIKVLGKAIILWFILLWAINYFAIIVCLISGSIKLSEVIVPNVTSVISLPYHLYIIISIASLFPFIYWRNWEKINYKHFCFLIVVIGIEIIVIFVLLGYLININIGSIKELNVFVTPWDVGVKIVLK
jgi:amino acid permease